MDFGGLDPQVKHQLRYCSHPKKAKPCSCFLVPGALEGDHLDVDMSAPSIELTLGELRPEPKPRGVLGVGCSTGRKNGVVSQVEDDDEQHSSSSHITWSL